jgi:hypothetical protein
MYLFITVSKSIFEKKSLSKSIDVTNYTILANKLFSITNNILKLVFQVSQRLLNNIITKVLHLYNPTNSILETILSLQ